ncbi:MAG: DNA-binding protein WhiA [Firmicutes bacterium]|nr:DNA-binding protein WhiA [Bacillota bacterium]
MAFSAETKKELARVLPEKGCCALAEITGFARINGAIRLAGGGRLGVTLSADSPAVARTLKKLVQDYFHAETSIEVVQGSKLRRRKSYRLIFEDPALGEMLLLETGLMMEDGEGKVLTDGIAPEIISRRCCRRACLRGLFLAGGSVSDPEKGYHLEIVCSSERTAADIRKLMNTFSLGARVVERRGSHVIYIKESEHIVDFLNIVGAHQHLLDYENVRIHKSILNQTNRIMNCESANMDKRLSAAEKHLEDIRVIEESGAADRLPKKLRDAAELRKAYPELSLRELAQMADPPVSKSGLNHRLEKIAEKADEIRKNS